MLRSKKTQTLDHVMKAMKGKDGKMRLQTMSQETSELARCRPEVAAVVSRYETPQNLLALFNPSNQLRYTSDIRRAYAGSAPTLGLVGRAFAYGTAKAWAAVQLWDLAEFSGCKTKMTEKQIDELAEIVCATYGFMKLTELMDFFRRFKLGEYGRFWGAVDPLVITEALREFARFRIQTISRLEREDAELKERTDPQEIVWRRKRERYYAINEFYADNFRSKDFTLEEFREIWWLFNIGYERDDHGYTERH